MIRWLKNLFRKPERAQFQTPPLRLSYPFVTRPFPPVTPEMRDRGLTWAKDGDGNVFEVCETCGGNCGQCGNTSRLGNIGFDMGRIAYKGGATNEYKPNWIPAPKK